MIAYWFWTIYEQKIRKIILVILGNFNKILSTSFSQFWSIYDFEINFTLKYEIENPILDIIPNEIMSSLMMIL